MNRTIVVLLTVFSFFSISASAGVKEDEHEENEVFQKNPHSLNGKGCISIKYTDRKFVGFIPCWAEDHDTPRGLEKIKGFKVYTEKGKFCVRTTSKSVSFVSGFSWWDNNGKIHHESKAYRLTVDSPKKLCVK